MVEMEYRIAQENAHIPQLNAGRAVVSPAQRALVGRLHATLPMPNFGQSDYYPTWLDYLRQRNRRTQGSACRNNEIAFHIGFAPVRSPHA